MGRKRLFPDNATRQRAFQTKKREEELKVKIEEAQKLNSNQANQETIDVVEVLKSWYPNNTLEEVEEAYIAYKKMYKVIGVDILFQQIHFYLDDETPLVHGITIGDIQQDLEMGAGIKCVVCGYERSVFESDGCPECYLRLHNYKAWLAFRKSLQ